jgi:hypothetical protein
MRILLFSFDHLFDGPTIVRDTTQHNTTQHNRATKRKMRLAYRKYT